MLPKEIPGSPHGYAAGHPLPVWVIFDAPQGLEALSLEEHSNK
jgi:hypothetical protein